MVGMTAFRRERVLDRGTFFLRAAERRSVPVFFPAGFFLRAVFFFAILRSLSLGSHRVGMASMSLRKLQNRCARFVQQSLRRWHSRKYQN